MFQKYLLNAVTPNHWKGENVIPIYKKGSRNMSWNSRPVIVTWTVSKVLELILREALVDHFREKKY